MINYHKIEEAIKFLSSHIGTIEKLGKPTLLHSMNVGHNLLSNGYGEDIVIAGFLHDIIEDTNITKEIIKETFGENVVNLILANSKNSDITKDKRDSEMFDRCIQFGKEAMIIKAYDIFDNYLYFSKTDEKEKIERINMLLRLFISRLPNDYTEDIFQKIRNLRKEKKSNIILLNGACGIGKSTIAKLLHEKLEFSFLREKDQQRRNISHYKDTTNHQNRSGSMILDLTKHVIQSCVEDCVDMIFDGVLVDREYITSLQKFIDTTGGRLVHIYLNAPKEIRSERLKARGIEGSLTYEKAEFFYDSLTKLNQEIKMIELDTNTNTQETICNKIIEILD